MPMPAILLHRLIPLMVAVHRCISSSDRATRAYLLLLSFLVRPMADSVWKHRLLNVLDQTAWPHVSLPPKVVLVGGQTPLRLIPHVGEFDFAALFFRSLTYEAEVFQELTRRQRHDIKVFAFEPAKEPFTRLCASLQANQLAEVATFHCAISDATGFVPLFEPAGHLTNGSLLADFEGLFSKEVTHSLVLAISGDLLSSLVQPDQRALMKIDVEGASTQVLQAMRPMIESTLPEIVIEVLSVEEAGFNRLAWLTRLYEIYLITAAGLVPQASFAANDRHRDYWLKPIMTVSK